MDDYVRVYYKSTGKLAIMQLLLPNGGMNPDFSKTKFVTDDDLNKSLEYYVSLFMLFQFYTSRNITCRVAELNAPLCLVTRV